MGLAKYPKWGIMILYPIWGAQLKKGGYQEMKVTLVGFKSVDFKDDNGDRVSAYLYCC